MSSKTSSPSDAATAPKEIILLIDNYDSFTWNVFQRIACLLEGENAEIVVKRNDQISLEEALLMNISKLIISPGPGYPASAGCSMEFIRYFAGKVPILGVCLGEQCMYELYGGKVVPCGELVHGKTTPVQHDGLGLFAGIDQNIECTRYHSLAGDANTLPSDDLVITSWTDSGIVMGVRHKKYVMEGVQFHPESIASEQGDLIFANFLSWNGGVWDELVTTPLNINKSSTSTTNAQDDKMLGKGIPLHLATKMNSTARVVESVVEQKQSSILQKIFKQRQLDVALEKLSLGGSMAYLERCYALNISPPLIDFPSRLSDSISLHSLALLAEIKRASPSKGDIDMRVHAPQQSLLYASGGASAISVLTEPTWFKGSLTDLHNVRLALDKLSNRPAVLCKEFVFDTYQILQARLAGADTVLLIVAMLSDSVLEDLMAYSRTLGMEPLVEVASASEMHRALNLGAKVVGVNNRDLNTFTVDMTRTSVLAGMAEGVLLLALSGIKHRRDVETYVKAGAKGVLVGESLMKSKDKVKAVQHLLTGAPLDEEEEGVEGTVVKVCGLTNVEDAKVALENGAGILGFIFASKSPRCVGRDTVREITTALSSSKSKSSQVLRTDGYSAPPVSAKDWFAAQKLPAKRPLFVGVFTDHTVHEINQITIECNLDLIQLHTPRPPSFHRLLNRPVVQVVGISSSSKFEELEKFAKTSAGSCMALLLDTTTPHVVGGSGQVFDWKLSARLGLPIWMAGGLDPSNVAPACKIGNPLVVDVCSGVEIDGKKGFKDHVKLKKFLDAVKEFNKTNHAFSQHR